MNDRLFIGYGSLDGLLDTHPPGTPVLISLCEEPGTPGRHGVALDTFALTVSDTRDNHARYCRLTLGHAQTVNGEALDPALRERTRRRALSAYRLVEEYVITRYGFAVERATVAAVPRDLKLLDGWADFLRYDKQTDRFFNGHPGREE